MVEDFPPNSLIKILVPVIKDLLSRIEEEGFQIYLLAESFVLAHKFGFDVFDKFDISQFGTLLQNEILPLPPDHMKIFFSRVVFFIQLNFPNELCIGSDRGFPLLSPVIIEGGKEKLSEDKNGDQYCIFNPSIDFLEDHCEVGSRRRISYFKTEKCTEIAARSSNNSLIINLTFIFTVRTNNFWVFFCMDINSPFVS